MKRDEDALFSAGRVRALFDTVLPWERIGQMARAPGRAAAWQILCGGKETGGVQNAARHLEAEKAALFASLAQSARSTALVRMMQVPYDCHNAKVLLKGHLLALEEQETILSPCGAVAPESIREAVATGQAARLPHWMRRGLAAATQAWKTGRNARLLDMALDEAAFAAQQDMARASGVAAAEKYVETVIDSVNLCTLLRMRQMQPEALETLLFAGGSVPREHLLEGHAGGSMTAAFAEPQLRAAAAAGEARAAERAAVQSLRTLSRRWSMASSGGEILLGFLVQVELRQRAVRMVLAQKDFGGEALREEVEAVAV